MENFILSSTTLVGTDVKNIQGENLGTVKDIAIDTQSGKVAYLVLAFGGFIGINDKYFAIPFQAFSIDQKDEKLILNVDKEVLENAPGFDRDHMPDYPQREFVDEVYSYYGYGAFLKEKVKEEAGHNLRTKSLENTNDPWDRKSEAENNLARTEAEDTNTRNRAFDPDNNKRLF